MISPPSKRQTNLVLPSSAGSSSACAMGSNCLGVCSGDDESDTVADVRRDTKEHRLARMFYLVDNTMVHSSSIGFSWSPCKLYSLCPHESTPPYDCDVAVERFTKRSKSFRNWTISEGYRVKAHDEVRRSQAPPPRSVSVTALTSMDLQGQWQDCQRQAQPAGRPIVPSPPRTEPETESRWVRMERLSRAALVVGPTS